MLAGIRSTPTSIRSMLSHITNVIDSINIPKIIMTDSLDEYPK